MADLFFCPERWEPDSMISTNAASQIQVRGFSGRTAEAWQLGDWGSDWTAITSRIPIEAGWLESGQQYRFCFWLNGGENSRGDEACMLEIYGDDSEDRLCFRLNRGHTKPILQKNHWLLFAVPFTAPQASEAPTFRFIASGAVCTIAGIPQMNMSFCESLTPDDPDEEPHPQRHNIVFPHGWPNEERKVVLKARGRELELSAHMLRLAAGAAGLTAGILLLKHCSKRAKKKKHPGNQ